MTDELVKQWDEYVESMGSVMGGVEHMAQQMRDRIEALIAERDKAYANGYSDAETEISKSALGQSNTFLHSRYADAKLRIEALTVDRAEARAGWHKYEGAWMAAEGKLADVEAERDQLRKLLDAIMDEYEIEFGLTMLSIDAARDVLWGEKEKNMSDLLPCRFCRFTPHAWLDDYINGRAVTDPEYIIECENGNCSVMPEVRGTYPYMDEVRAMWNAANALPVLLKGET